MINTYRCPRCKQDRCTTGGSKFVHLGKHRRRICASCVAELAAKKRPSQQQEQRA